METDGVGVFVIKNKVNKWGGGELGHEDFCRLFT